MAFRSINFRSLAIGAVTGSLCMLALWASPLSDRAQVVLAQLQQAARERLAEYVHANNPSATDARALVAALVSSDAERRGTATRLLLEQVARSRDLPPAVAAEQFTALAELLADASGSFDEEAARVAVEITRVMLAWQVEHPEVNSGPLLAACDAVFSAPAARGVRAATRSAKRAPGRTAFTASATESRDSAPLAVAPLSLPMTQVPALAGGDLPIEAREMPFKATPEPAPPAFVASPETRPLKTQPPPIQADSPREEVEGARPIAATLRHPEDELAKGVEDEAAQELVWMRALRHGDPNVVRRAAERLAQVGYGPVQLEMARRLTDDDPAVRRKLAESLPRARGIDTQAWLMWLSKDADASVRLTAITTLATTGDPRVVKQVARAAQLDPDERIQEQGERILKAMR